MFKTCRIVNLDQLYSKIRHVCPSVMGKDVNNFPEVEIYIPDDCTRQEGEFTFQVMTRISD